MVGLILEEDELVGLVIGGVVGRVGHQIKLIMQPHHFIRQFINYFMYFHPTFVRFRNDIPFRLSLPPYVTLRSQAICTKLTMNFYIQFKDYSYYVSLFVICNIFNCSSFTCFSKRAICKADSVSGCTLLFGFIYGEQSRAIIPLGLTRGSFSIRLMEAVFCASIDQIWILERASSSYLRSLMALSLSRLLRLSWLISYCSIMMMLFCGFTG